MCNSMRKPTGSSGIDNFTAKCQALNRSFYALEEESNATRLKPVRLRNDIPHHHYRTNDVMVNELVEEFLIAIDDGVS